MKKTTFSLQTLISLFVRQQLRPLGKDFVDFVSQEIFETEKLSRTGVPSFISSYFPPFPSRSFKRLVAALASQRAGKPVPEMVNIALTCACPCNCWHCSIFHRPENELSTTEIISVIEQFLELGCYHIGLTGGEPLQRGDLVEIVASIRRRAVSLLYTTGIGFDEQRAKQLKKAGLTAIQISLDHSQPEQHDALRQRPGSFQKAVNALALAQKTGFLSCVTTVATPERILSGELESFCLLMKRLGAEEVTLFEPAAIGKLKDDQSVFLNQGDRDYLMELHKKANHSRRFPRLVSLSFVESRHRLGCQAGYTRFYITSGGEMTPCDFTPLSFGNVCRERVRDIIARMHSSFKLPGKDCFYRQNYARIADEGREELPLPAEVSNRICQQLDRCSGPLFYQKLTVTSELDEEVVQS
ncbi:radical SAM protein [bacterium]|nr:radical SAM protein [bacterium]